MVLYRLHKIIKGRDAWDIITLSEHNNTALKKMLIQEMMQEERIRPLPFFPVLWRQTDCLLPFPGSGCMRAGRLVARAGGK